MAKLFILGDSFSFPHKTTDKLWPAIVADELAKKSNSNIELVNHSLIGASQDYVWKTLQDILPQITPSDFLIIVLTSCDRFWYFEKKPEYSNMMTYANIAQATDDPALHTTLFNFITRLWRPALALQLQNHRLGYLSYYVLKKNLRRPLILKGFQYDHDHEKDFPELNFSQDCLARIQFEEFEKFNGDFGGADLLMDAKYWHHVDCRYNHMCLSNHSVLGKTVSQGLLNNSTVDLGSNEFYKNIVTEKNCKDKNYAAKEFCIKYFNEMLSNSVRQKLGAKSFQLFF